MLKKPAPRDINRRKFIQYNSALLFLAAATGGALPLFGAADVQQKTALAFQHFPNTFYAFLWRNWGLVPLSQMAKTVSATTQQLLEAGKLMGLAAPQPVSDDQLKRSYLTIIRRNWHILPEDQLLALLDWPKEKLAFTLKEDDFFFIKMGSFKPVCSTLNYAEQAKLPSAVVQQFRERMHAAFPKGLPDRTMSYFDFVQDLSAPATAITPALIAQKKSSFSPRIAYPYFALFGDPLLQDSHLSYPDGYLDRLAASGVDAIWLHLVLHKVTPFPWDLSVSDRWEQRLNNLKLLAERTSARGIGIYFYLNEPRHQAPSFFKEYPHLRGYSNALCTSVPEVRSYLVDSIARIVETAPSIGGFFSITASENPTNCWSHNQGDKCTRCSKQGVGAVIGELNNTFRQGISQGMATARKTSRYQGPDPQLIIWDWGWRGHWAAEIIPKIKNEGTALMSVSEWELPIERGGIKSKVGEYSISAIGPGPRALKHWDIAKKHGHRIVAKIQANNSWELGAVPYIPAVYNVASHVDNLRKAGIDGLMLSWSLGGYPSPNLEVVKEMTEDDAVTMDEAMIKVTDRRFGLAGAAVRRAWKTFSESFGSYPFNMSLIYNSPLHSGPSNLLFREPTGYAATMTGFPYDDVTTWRSVYPVQTYIDLFRELSRNIFSCERTLVEETRQVSLPATARDALDGELRIIRACGIHFATVANQAEFVELRNQVGNMERSDDKKSQVTRLQAILRDEIRLSKQLADLQFVDSRIGFEASNHYFYTPNDLYEKVLNCQYLLDDWLGELT